MVDGHLLAPKEDCFYKHWRKYFPCTCLSSEIICPECYTLIDQGINLYAKDSHEWQVAQKKLEEHKRNADAQTKYSLNLRDEARFNKKPILSVVMDYKGGDLLPTTRPSTYKFNCFPRLVMHYSGFLLDHDNSAHYYLHTEHWPESGNSIITTLNKLLTKLPR
eukprot:Phypoly_transcript_10030.p1 GENE.Phypoly_transcript_10030~~Phypoly_transcript_10030.p1  ORF type:complete len:163 (+),score=12.50 Phypoly_transcript_10030:2-490(+)